MKDLSQHRPTRLFLTILLLTIGWLNASAQSLSVESFKLLEIDLTANTNGTIEYDQNGEKAALIKIITTETGFVFEAGMMGIVKTVQKVAEIWVYVPHGLQRLKILHPQLGQVEYNIPISIESARTYELRLISGRVRTIVQDEVAAQYVVFTVKPQSAIVTIDNMPYGLQSDGTVSQLLSYGTHSYRIDAPGYVSEIGEIEVGRERIMRDVTLRTSQGKVTLDCAMKEADIYVNGNLVGRGNWTGQLDAAMYHVEIKRDGYSSRSTSFTLQPQEEKTITLPVPQPIYSTISVTSQPIGATVLVDGVEVGTTPLIKGEILTGHRKIEFHKKDYNSVSMDVEVKEGELNSFSAELSEIHKKKARSDGSTSDLSVSLQPKKLRPTNFYLEGNYGIGHISGAGVNIGSYIKGVNLECGYTLPLGVPNTTLLWLINTSYLGEREVQYEYSLYRALSVHLGYGILLGNSARLTPKIGAVFNQIKGEYLGDGNGNSMDQNTHVVSGRLGIRMEYSPIPYVGLVCTPSYDIPFKYGNIAGKLDANADFIQTWCSGFLINMGVELYF